MLELTATIVIISFLVVGGYFYLASYKDSTQTVSQGITLKTLNDALDQYRLYGGMSASHSLGGATSPTKIVDVITALKNGLTLNGLRTRFLPADAHISTTGITCSGSGRDFMFKSSTDTVVATSSSPTPAISATSSINFGTVSIGSTPTATMTLHNTGGSTLTVSAISYPSGYSGNWVSGTIAAGASQNITVTFTPVAAQTYSGDITISSNAASGSGTIAVSGLGAASTISLSGNMAFGSVKVGDTATRTLMISNSGALPFTVTSLTLPSGYTSSWSSGTIAAGGFKNVNITFSPVASTSYNGTITVNSNAGAGTSTVSVTGSGTQGTISLSGSMAFGTVCINTTTTATLTISNSGSYPLTVSSISLPSGYTADWTEGIIAAGGFHNVTVTFAPVALTTYNGTITVTSNAASGTNTRAVTGTGGQPEISLSGSMAFGNVAINTTATSTLTISNPGTTALAVSSISYPTGYSGAWSGTVAAGGNHNVTVTFSPTLVQSYNGTITVNSDKLAGTNTLSVSGAGVVPTRIIALSGSMAFGSIAQNTTSTATLTIQNTGNVTMTVSSISYPSGYSGNWASGTIASGGSQAVTVTFAPTSAATYNGTITVNSDKTSGTETSSATGTGEDLTTGLKLYYSMDNADIWGTSIIDLSANGYTGTTYSGPTSATGTVGQALGFAGGISGQYAKCNLNKAAIGSNLTIAAWISPTSNASTTGILQVANSLSDGTPWILFQRYNSTQTRWFLNGGYQITESVANDSYSHLVLTYNGSTWQAYKNGAADGSYLGAIGGNNGGYTWLANGYNGYFAGSMDEVRIYNRALSANAVSALYHNTQAAPAYISLGGNMAFNGVPVSLTATSTLTITNYGSTSITVSSISYPSGYSGNWASGTIAAGASQAVTVTFAPQAIQSYNGTITVNSDATLGTNTIAITGSGTAPAGVIAVSGNMAFGSLVQNTTSTSTLTIQNTGNSTLTVTSISYPSGYSGAWSGTIAAGASQNVTVTFAPTSGTTYNGTITVNSDAVSGTNTLSATGTGEDITTGLLLYYSMDNADISGTSVIDLSGSGNTGTTYNSPVSTTGNTGQALSFTSASSQYVKSNLNKAAVGSTLTISAWLKPTGAQSTKGILQIADSLTNGVPFVLFQRYSSTHVRWWMNSGYQITEAVNDNSYYHLVVTFDGSTWQAYKNGVPDGSYVGPLGPNSGNYTWLGNGYNGYLSGAMDEVRIYNRALSANAVAALYNYTAVAPAYVSLSGNMAFGNVTVNSTATATLTITNYGSNAMTVSSISYPSGYSGAWSGTIATGASQTVTVTFSPTLGQSYNGTITVNSNATTGTNTIAATGTGISRIIALSGSMAFGTVNVGSTGTATLTIQNTGNSTMTVSSISYPSGYTGNWASGTIAAGGSQNVTVTFTPVAATTYNGTITVNSDKTSGTETASATGTGAAGTRIIGLIGSMDFNTVPVNTTATRTLTITNSGNSTLTVSSISYPANYSGNWASGTIAAGGTQNVTVSFTPTARTAYLGNITVNSDKTSGTNTIAVTGSGGGVVGQYYRIRDLFAAMGLDTNAVIVPEWPTSTATVAPANLNLCSSGKLVGKTAALNALLLQQQPN